MDPFTHRKLTQDRFRHRIDTRVFISAILLLLLPGLLVVASRPASAPSARENDAPTPDEYDWATPQSHVPDPGVLAVGITHTQYSIGNWANPAANASASAVLTATATYQNQHIFGWGALSPEPRPGEFDWTSLDRRIGLIRATHGTPVITLCCSPDWMKGGQPGQTDWTRIAEAPTPDHYADFAALAVAVAQRYPDVRRFQVWNELKGFWNKALNRWDYEAYTDFYNVVYDALKAYDPSLAVGGPYVVIDVWGRRSAGGYPSRLTGDCGTIDQRSLDVLDYWLQHKHGADFVAVDASTNSRDNGMVTSTTTGAALFGAITLWLRQRTSLPVWWSEFHVGRADSNGQTELIARAMAALLHMIDTGAAAAFVWQPERDAGPPATRAPAVWTSTADADGGRPLGYAEALARLQQVLADRVAPDPVSWPRLDVGVIRGRNEVLLVHTGGGPVDVELAGQALRLAPYEVRYLPMPGDLAIPAASTPSVPAMTAVDRCLHPVPAPQQFVHGRVSR
jgi:glycosyl hydrolase family 39 (putative alpha-L-iduronidase)